MSQKRQNKRKQVQLLKQRQENQQIRQQQQEQVKKQYQEQQEKEEKQHKVLMQETLKSMLLMLLALSILSGDAYKFLGSWVGFVIVMIVVLYVYQVITLVYMMFSLSQRTWIEKIVHTKIREVFK